MLAAAHSQLLHNKRVSSADTVRQKMSRSSMHRMCSRRHPIVAGLLGVPGICTPDLYVEHWSSSTRPHLEALWGSVLRTSISNPARLLFLVDQLLMQLRSTRSLAVHIQQHHTDPAWAAAGAEVAASCRKYESFVEGNKALQNKLNSAQNRLAAAAAAGGTVAAAAVEAGGDSSSMSGETRGCSTQQLLQLCQLLLASVQHALPSDSLEWLAVVDAPDSNAQQLAVLLQQEQHLIAAVDKELNRPVVLQLPAPLDQLLAPPQQQQQAASGTEQRSTNINTSSQQTPCGTAAAACGSAVSTTSMLQSGTAAAAAAAAADELVGEQRLLVSRSQLVALLQQSDDSVVRQQAYSVGLQQKLSQSALLLDQLARCRQQQAWLRGHSTHLQQVTQSLSQMEAGSSSSGGGGLTGDDDPPRTNTAANFLLQLAGAARPLVEQEVDWIVRQQEQHATERQQQSASWGAWDWDWLLHQVQKPPSDPALSHHLHLTAGVLAGLSNMLQQTLGLRLLVRPAGDVEAWARHVVVVMVVKPSLSSAEQQPEGKSSSPDNTALLGTIYLDIGGGFGTRMLRYTHQGSAGTREPMSVASRQSSDNLPALLQQQSHHAPAVAVGIAGSRSSVAATTAGVCAAVEGVGTGIDSGASHAADIVLSVRQLFELGHELGHALHLILSSRQAACHLSGRFVSPRLIEVPSQLFERLFTQPAVLAQVCLHHSTAAQLPADLSGHLAAYYSCRYSSALALCGRAAAGLAEQMYGEFGGDGEDYWRGCWQAVSGLPDAVAAGGCLQEVALLPVMAAHKGTFHCYLEAWCIAADLAESIFQTLLLDAPPSTEELRQAAWTVMGMPAGKQAAEDMRALCRSMDRSSAPSEDVLSRWLWHPE